MHLHISELLDNDFYVCNCKQKLLIYYSLSSYELYYIWIVNTDSF